MDTLSKSETWGYFKISKQDDWQRNVARLIQAGVSSGNIFFESDGTCEFHRMLSLVRRRDSIVVLSIADACHSLDELFKLSEWLIKHGINLHSVSEPWFRLSKEKPEGIDLYNLINRLYELHIRLADTNNKPTSHRPVGRPRGVRPEVRQKLDMALVMYQERSEMPVAEVCNLMGLNQRAFYRYLCQQDSSVVRRSRGRKPKGIQ